MTTHEQMEANQRTLVRILREGYGINDFDAKFGPSAAIAWVQILRVIETKLEKVLESIRAGKITPLQVAHLWAFPYEEKHKKRARPLTGIRLIEKEERKLFGRKNDE